MATREKSNTTVVSSKGQVVIPRAIREKLGIEPQAKLLVYGYRGAVIMKKLTIPDVTKELEEIYEKVDAKIAKHGELAEKTIDEIIQEYRKGKTEIS